MASPPPRRIEPLTTAVRDFRRISSTTAFASRWLGGAVDALEGGQYDVLDRLTEREAWRMGELASALRVDPSAVTRAVLPLEQLGFVARAKDPNDGRAVLVQITARGRIRLELARSQGLHMWAEALQEFSDRELVTFAKLMRRLAGSFEALLFGNGSPAARVDPSSETTDPPGSDVDGLAGAGMGEVLRRLAMIEQQLSTTPVKKDA